jgi:hypothetical protein
LVKILFSLAVAIHCGMLLQPLMFALAYTIHHFVGAHRSYILSVFFEPHLLTTGNYPDNCVIPMYPWLNVWTLSLHEYYTWKKTQAATNQRQRQSVLRRIRTTRTRMATITMVYWLVNVILQMDIFFTKSSGNCDLFYSWHNFQLISHSFCVSISETETFNWILEFDFFLEFLQYFTNG